jgi:hypothetical protein
MERLLEFITRRVSVLFILLIIAIVSFGFVYPVQQKVNLRAVVNSVEAESHKVTVTMRVDARDIVRVQKGMEVKLSWDLYPYEVYGFFIGTVKTIDLKPQKSVISDKTYYLVQAEVEVLQMDRTVVVPGQEGNADIIFGTTSWFHNVINGN